MQRVKNKLEITLVDADGTRHVMPPTYNARVNVGAALSAYLLSGSNLGSLTSPNVPKYIALSTSTLTIAATDTTLSGETSATGMGRTAGTIGTYTAPGSLDGAASYLITNTFTNSSGSTVTIGSSALFDASSGGNMFSEANFTSPIAVLNTQQLIITWTFNL
jgi:hypothetical protein